MLALGRTWHIVRRQTTNPAGADQTGLGENTDNNLEKGYGEPYDTLIANALIYGTVVSMIICMGVFATFFWMRRAHPNLVSRVSFRLAMGINLANFFYALFYLLTAFPPATAEASLHYCAAIMYITIVSELTSLFLSVSVSLNLLVIFVMKRKNKAGADRWYFIGALVLAMLVPLPALVKRRFGVYAAECWFRYPEDEGPGGVVAWQWASLYGWVLISVFFCTFTAITFWYIVGGVSRSIKRDLSERPASNPNIKAPGTDARKTDHLVHQAVWRISTYCIVPFIAQIFCIECDLEDYARGQSVWWTYFLGNLLTGMQGALQGFIFFLVDPAMCHVREDIRLQLVYKHHLRYLPPPSSTSSLSITPSLRHSTLSPYEVIRQYPRTRYEKCMRKVVEAVLVRERDAAAIGKINYGSRNDGGSLISENTRVTQKIQDVGDAEAAVIEDL
ncbi:hypothetical protein HK104_000778 [Borealophlyctis nickersoniae]|nr:hypothetical protein HK104_000778 [Borealophlyctis nickersoniae]